MAIYKDIPVMTLNLWIQEWEDYGNMGMGDVNGNPFRTGEYLSFDNYGEYPIAPSLKECLSQVIEDEQLIKKVVSEIADWLVDKSYGIETHMDLSDCFELEEDIVWDDSDKKNPVPVKPITPIMLKEVRNANSD